MIVANSSKALGDSELENKVTATNFTVNPKTESRMLQTFDSNILKAMSTEKILLHLHHHELNSKKSHSSSCKN